MKKDKEVLILGIESSCDETAASVVKNGREILSDGLSDVLSDEDVWLLFVLSQATAKVAVAAMKSASKALAVFLRLNISFFAPMLIIRFRKRSFRRSSTS